MTDIPSEDEASRQPRIILGDRTGSRGEQPQLRSSDELDWEKQFGRRSPLSRKIITFNLVALGMLVAGILYLSQFQDGLIELRELGLEREAKIMAAAVDQVIGDGALAGDNQIKAIQALRPLSAASDSSVRLFDRDAVFLGTSVSRETSALPKSDAALEPVRESALTSIMNQIWERMSRLYRNRVTEDGPEIAQFSVAPIALEAIQKAAIIKAQGTNEAGQRILTVAVPVLSPTGNPKGAVVLSSRAGDVDTVVRNEREQILQVFALAMFSSIVLSLVLANTIVGPLRDLANAAQKGGTRNSSRLNPERIHIPDMSGRPDEIGFLSGAMRMMTTALYDRIEANEAFAADVAHEIKNPLTSLRSAVDTFPYAKDDQARGRLLSVIRADVDRLDRLVTDISNASRLDRELVRDEMLEFDLQRLLVSLVEYNSSNAEDVGAKLVDNTNGPLVISGLEGRLAQVFVNLITNAISFSGANDVVTVSCTRDGRTARVMIEDTGPGIPDDNLKDVFSRFYSERPDQQFGNHSGLGLAISKQIVEAHGGAIWAENIRDAGQGTDTPAKGARFVVELPI